MARAKRTDRAEARRRYRAYLQEQMEPEAAQGVEGEEPPARSTGDRPARSAGSAGSAGRPVKRVGFLSAFKVATRPVHYIDDLRYAPTLIFRTNAIWTGAALSVAALAVALTRTDYNDGVLQVVTGFVLSITPMVQPMLAGFLAPRATWLAGIIASLISGACFEILLLWTSAGHYANTPAKVLGEIKSSDYAPLTFQVALTAITFGALLGAGSGWYKRFLSLTGPASAMAQQRTAAQKQGARRPSARR